jgi:hypothetical protein
MMTLSAALAAAGRAAMPGSATVVAVRLPLDAAAPRALADLLDVAGDACTRLVLACPPVGQRAGAARAEPARIAALVRALEAGGWEVRTERLPLPECALTGCVLVEARRAPKG